MPSFRQGVVTRILSRRPGLQRVEVDGEPTYVLTGIVGPVAEGDPVIVNTTATELGLGTGGWHVLHWNLARRELHLEGGGHLMKLRYTSLQADTGVAEEDGVEIPAELEGIPVVICGLHSQLTGVAAGFADGVGGLGARLVYVMTDGAALPLALSDTVAELAARGLIHATVTAGHAFGGDAEALTVASALCTARHRQGADAVVVGMGPGIAGTGTALGHTGLEVGPLVDTVLALGGRPVVALRYSEADDRARHRGISHHAETALTRFCAGRALIPLVPGIEAPAWRHQFRTVEGIDPVAVFAAHALTPRTMGRGADEEPNFFALSLAAGLVAAELAMGGAPVGVRAGEWSRP